jgi:hypothetical protein
MIQRRAVVGNMVGLAVEAAIDVPADAARPLPADHLNQLGPENERIAKRVGLWDVTETVWARPGAKPVTTNGMVAERVMMGQLLQEFMRCPSDAAHRAVARTDLLSFNRIEGRWKYMSFDTRAPVGLMPAASMGRGDGQLVELIFDPFAAPPSGPQAVGQLLRMIQVIRFDAPDCDVKDQYFMPADGSGVRWLAHRYEYVRRA